MTFKQHFRERLQRQGKKIDARFKDRPMSRERYEQMMTFIGALLILYLVASLLCVFKVIGEWL